MNPTHTHRITVSSKPEVENPRVQHLINTIQEYFHVTLEELEINRIFFIEKPLSKEQLEAIAKGLLIDPVTELSTIEKKQNLFYDWTIEIGFKPGLTDNLGNTAHTTIEDFLGIKFFDGEKVTSSTQYLVKGNLSQSDIQTISEKLLANPLIEEISIQKNKKADIEEIPINVSDTELLAISNGRQLALNLKEMQAIKLYFSRKDVQEQRQKVGLSPNPTDVEIEALAQTWSEHCKHKIFNANITYQDENGIQEINSLFNTYIKGATDKIQKPWLVSIFTDNAGIFQFNKTFNIAFKVETHNSPSALDPYGGALTGILGVNRDIMGAGNGARLLANTDIFCFAPPDYNKPLPERLLHPKRVFEGVRKGVEHGGNKSGVPTVNGAIVYDERFLGKPLVYCGSVGIMPSTINGKKTHIKTILPNDLIIIAGGRTGKDGIHGATFSSEELHANSPTSAVQIGDPFTQKKLHDFLLEARDKELYRTLTDNGAGGFSSSVGELATLSGGCDIHLDRALLKYQGLTPWEILLSESQERMTLAAPVENWQALQDLANVHEVELCQIGTFTDTGKFHVFYQEKTAAYLDMEFLHEGVPKLDLEAEWKSTVETPFKTPEHFISSDPLHLLESLNIRSKEEVIRQYDHEVQASTVIKPLQGASEDGPGDAAVIHPLECQEDNQGICIANGICPKFSDIDTYHMATNAVDEAIRNSVAVGCDPDTIAILDNFCWPDPIFDEDKTPDGKYKLAQLVRANKGLYDCAIAFQTPIISGKDSMKNDYKIAENKISIPPTLLISAIGKIHDIHKAVTMDVKAPGDWVYIVGLTKNELGGSEYARMAQVSGGIVPRVDLSLAKKIYKTIHEAITQEIIQSCHDASDGGLCISLMESAFAGGFGMTLDMHSVPMEGIHTDTELLFSESASRFVVTVSPECTKTFDQLMDHLPIGRIGVVTEDTRFKVTGIHGESIIDEEINTLKAFWKNHG